MNENEKTELRKAADLCFAWDKLFKSLETEKLNVARDACNDLAKWIDNNIGDAGHHLPRLS